MVLAGSAWILFLSLFNELVLDHAPDWVRARVLAISTLVFQGAIAAGSAVFGVVAARFGIGSALLYAGVGTIATTALAPFLRLPDTTVDLTSWNNWRLPATKDQALPTDHHFGPVLVTSNIKLLQKKPRSSSQRFVNIDGFGVATARAAGAFSATWRMRISTSKPSS
jgi:MFS family permease